MIVVNRGGVLLVARAPAVAAACARALRDAGWTVTLAWDLDTGLAAVGAPTAYDCVVIDVELPGNQAFDFVRALHARCPAVPVLLVVGPARGAVPPPDLGALPALRHPLEPAALVAAVARATALPRPAALPGGAAERGARAPHDGDDALAARFVRALAGGWVAFQPIVDAVTARVRGYEALLRTDEAALRRPAQLLALAERLGRVHEVGRVARAAIARAAAAAPPGCDVFVNLHTIELLDDELYDPAAPLAAIAERIVLELPERLAADGLADARARVARLRRLGFRIAIDNLRGDPAVLGALAALAPEAVKLDLALVRDLDAHPTNWRTVAAVATLCRELRAAVVAVGVERDAEWSSIAAAGVELVQGHLFAAPARGFLRG
ncbi:MAG: EAL domain-containing response regulator [Myxococcales bacterium]|nr:EAL domain-containing response regulator [Myxococcales bacterium]